MNLFERYLTLWVFLCIIAGIALGRLFPAAFQAAGGTELTRINLPVAALVWLVEVPVMLAVARMVNRSRAWYERRPGIPTYERCCPAGEAPSPG